MSIITWKSKKVAHKATCHKTFRVTFVSITSFISVGALFYVLNKILIYLMSTGMDQGGALLVIGMMLCALVMTLVVGVSIYSTLGY